MVAGAKQTLGINGTRTSGHDVRTENARAIAVVANTVRSSLGPMGLDKMIVDEVGDVLVTNDGATILSRLDVEHPAARMLVDLAQLQDREVGDGTTSVVLIAAELLKKAHELVETGIHPTRVITGYKIALKSALTTLNDMSFSVDKLSREVLLGVARTSMASKILGSHNDHFAALVVDAILAVQSINDLGDLTYPRKAVSSVCVTGKSAIESELVNGMALHLPRAAQGMPIHINNAQIACLDVDFRAVKMRPGVTLTVTDPTAAEGLKKREQEITKERLQCILKAGANVLLTTGGIDDGTLKVLVDAGAIGVRRVPLSDLRRVAAATGAQVIHELTDLNGNESFEKAWLGKAKQVEERHLGDEDMIFMTGVSEGRQPLHSKSGVTILLRGANALVLEEMDRALNDALWAVSGTLEAGRVLPGGGACEAALSVSLDMMAQQMGTREQRAVADFGSALLTIPRTLAANAALDIAEVVAKLRVAHVVAWDLQLPSHLSPSGSFNKATLERSENGLTVHCGARDALWIEGATDASDLSWTGLDLHTGGLRNAVAAGIVEPLTSKAKSLNSATEVAITILRIDDTVRLNPEERDEDPRSGGPAGGMM